MAHATNTVELLSALLTDTSSRRKQYVTHSRCSDEARPPYTITELTAMAVLGTSDRLGAVFGIYNWRSHRFPYFRQHKANSSKNVRKALDNEEAFVEAGPGKGVFWTIAPGMECMFIDSSMNEASGLSSPTQDPSPDNGDGDDDGDDEDEEMTCILNSGTDKGAISTKQPQRPRDAAAVPVAADMYATLQADARKQEALKTSTNEATHFDSRSFLAHTDRTNFRNLNGTFARVPSSQKWLQNGFLHGPKNVAAPAFEDNEMATGTGLNDTSEDDGQDLDSSGARSVEDDDFEFDNARSAPEDNERLEYTLDEDDQTEKPENIRQMTVASSVRMAFYARPHTFLETLGDTPLLGMGGGKPPYNNIILIDMALICAPQHRESVFWICQWISSHFAFYVSDLTSKTPWQKFVRARLCPSAFFVMQEKAARGHYWAIDPAKEIQLIKQMKELMRYAALEPSRCPEMRCRHQFGSKEALGMHQEICRKWDPYTKSYECSCGWKFPQKGILYEHALRTGHSVT